MALSPQISGQKKTVLVIDDDKWLHTIVNRFLLNFGFNTLNAYDPIDGLNKAINSKPELILLDIILPDFRGDFLLKLFKRLDITTHIPVIIMSSNMSLEILATTYKDGAGGFISKPITEQLLLDKINEVLQIKKVQDVKEIVSGPSEKRFRL